MENGGKKIVVMGMLKEAMVVLVPVFRPVSVVRLWSAGGEQGRQGQSDIVIPVPVNLIH